MARLAIAEACLTEYAKLDKHLASSQWTSAMKPGTFTVSRSAIEPADY